MKFFLLMQQLFYLLLFACELDLRRQSEHEEYRKTHADDKKHAPDKLRGGSVKCGMQHRNENENDETYRNKLNVFYAEKSFIVEVTHK